MLSEIECRAVSVVIPLLIEVFEPLEALAFFEKDDENAFSQEQMDVVRRIDSRKERVRVFAKLYRRHALNLDLLLTFLIEKNYLEIADFMGDYIYTAVHHPEKIYKLRLDNLPTFDFSNQSLERKLLLGSVPRQIVSFCREELVNDVIERLEDLCMLDSFFLVLHGRAGAGKSVVLSQALSRSPNLVGKCFESVIWLSDGGVHGKSTFDLFSDLLIMLKSEDDLMNFPCIENVTSVVLKRMIANALIDRPNTLFVFDDVVLEDTLRWAQELRLRCVITTRDVQLADVATVTCEFVEVTPMEVQECEEMLVAFGIPQPENHDEIEIMTQTVLISSGNPAVLSMFNKLCEPKTFDRLAQLNHRVENRGLAGLECLTPYRYKSVDKALQRCVQVLSEEDRDALAYIAVIPPDVDVPMKLWTAIVPVEVCSGEEDMIEDEVAAKLQRLSRKGEWVTSNQIPMLTYRIDQLAHMFLKHEVDKFTIRSALNALENRLSELANRSNNNYRRNSRGDYYAMVMGAHEEDYGVFMEKHEEFYNDLRRFLDQ